MEGYVLSFLKAEWMVNDTDSAHWTSSSFSLWFACSFSKYGFWLLLWYLQT